MLQKINKNICILINTLSVSYLQLVPLLSKYLLFTSIYIIAESLLSVYELMSTASGPDGNQ